MDAYDSTLGIFDEEKIYSNAIFSLDDDYLNEKMLIFFGSGDNRFITNRAYDLIFFLSKIIEQKTKRNKVKNELNNFLQKWLAWIKLERRLSTQTVKAYQTDLNIFFRSFIKT